jgi:preprotein translocase subunit SecB
MAENDTIAAFGEPQPNGADTAPAVGLLSQYVKDFSFENPNSPAIYQTQTAPAIDVQFNIGSAKVADDVYEVVLKIEVRAQSGEQAAFLVDLSYAGLFGIRNVPDGEALDGFLLGEAPRLLFPFARRVLADAVRDGGFPPLLLEPIDFGSIYMQQRAQAGELAQGQPAGEA